MEGQGGDVNRLMAENFHGLRRNIDEEEHENKSGGSDNIDVFSSDDFLCFQVPTIHQEKYPNRINSPTHICK
jgi:hypothetical protein